ncbi:MAG: apolipoprotein N-acyltransferase [Acidobacteriia bacterium]|nr:apolipoprotein N-acyltransferase [Terriglobia bacterium]
MFAWFAPALLLFAVMGARGGVAFAVGFLHEFVFVLAGVSWIATVLTVHGDIPRAGGIGVLALIAAYSGCWAGALAWCVARMARGGAGRALLAAPFLWVVMEFAQGRVPAIGFPWNLLGYAVSSNLALVQITALTGIYGLSFLVMAFNALVVWVFAAADWRRRIVFPTAGAAVILLAMIVLPRFVPQAPAAHFARAVQLNFPEAWRTPPDWYEINAAALAEIKRISVAPSAAAPDLVIWPESPTPFTFQDSQFAAMAAEIAVRAKSPVLMSGVEWKAAEARTPGAAPRVVPFNSAVLYDAQGYRIFSYDKIHLVPFGEYEPFPLIHRVVRTLTEDVGGFSPGGEARVGRLPGGRGFGVFICYESIFPGEVRRFAAGGAELLVNISNDGWFGRSTAPEQHLRIARVRAVENRRWLLRVTNNGYTVSVDPYGRIVARLPVDARLAGDLPYDFRADETLYTRWGDWFAWLCALISAILVLQTFWSVPTGAQQGRA